MGPTAETDSRRGQAERSIGGLRYRGCRPSTPGDPTGDTLRERIERIADVERGGDELVALAVTPDREIETGRREIEEDHAEAEYPDETAARPTQQALESVRRTLRDYESIPDGGPVIYADAGDAVFVFDDLPGTVEEVVYARDNEFDTAPVADITESGGNYGLLVVPTGSERGEQFAAAFGGIGAVLRVPID